MFARHDYVTRRELDHIVAHLRKDIALMATQVDIDTITTQVEQVATDLGNARTTLQAEIDQLAAANPTVDVSKLQAAVAPLDAAAVALGQLKPDQPAPTAPAA